MFQIIFTIVHTNGQPGTFLFVAQNWVGEKLSTDNRLSKQTLGLSPPLKTSKQMTIKLS
jgi:hypothetical protein